MTIQHIIASSGFALLLLYVATTAARNIKTALAARPVVIPPSPARAAQI